SLAHCGLAGETSGRLVSSIIRAHAARREGMVWSAGLRRPAGVVGHTAAAAPARISTAGCLAVDLSGNRLGDGGVHALARALQSDTWLLGLNLAHNEITDRGAALLSVCLHHNVTLCALVLDGNPDIGHEAERRITEELETRSMMPEAVLEEPEVVLSLASWGFSAHTGFDGDLPPPPPPLSAAAGSNSEVSEISHDSFRGGGGGGEFGDAAGWDGVKKASAMNSTSGKPKTHAERKEEMMREFRRWADYSPSSTQASAPHERLAATGAAVASTPPPPPPSTAANSACCPGHEVTSVRRSDVRGRPSTSVLLRGDAG
ncbi:unnamed protein product, partial [Scytosiphon promiscuus]